MPKLLHRILFLAVLSFALLSPVCFSRNASQIQDVKQNGEYNLVQNEVKVNDFEVEPINTKQVKNVVPDTKKEGVKVINLFLKVMSAVFISAFILYLVLITVKKYYSSTFISEETEDYESLNLSSPNNKEEALKSFLNRTK